jgi:hypothetical protein
MDIQDRARNEKLGDDLLHGVAQIAEFLNQPVGRVGYQIRRGAWPVFRTGKIIHARKSELRARASGQLSKDS